MAKVGLREHGYYWVKMNSSWIVAHYSHEADRWILPGITGWFYDSSFEEIDERRIEREPSVEEKKAKGDIKLSIKDQLNMEFEVAKNQKACEERFLEKERERWARSQNKKTR